MIMMRVIKQGLIYDEERREECTYNSMITDGDQKQM